MYATEGKTFPKVIAHDGGKYYETITKCSDALNQKPMLDDVDVRSDVVEPNLNLR